MGGPKENDKALKTPGGADQPTASYATPAPFDATAELNLSDPNLRALSQRYDLLAEVGRGGMGVVYKARDRETGDVVALKVLQPEIAARPDLIERFKAELLLARKITHKNICRTHELLRFGDTVVISMEYVEGESLRRLLERVEGLSMRHGLKILRQVIAGLAEAHAQGVVHRDLKPENILIARDGTVKVMDFGIARSLASGATQTVSVIGTPAYMSPEQAEGKPVDHRTDIYSLGLMIYEMFTGRPAFQAETPVALAMKQVHERPPAARSIEPDLPARIERAIEKCLEKKPEKRFQSVAELEAALSERPALDIAPEGEPVPAPHLTRWAGFDWVLLVLGVAGLIYFLGFRDQVFPASKLRLEVDAITARRAAEDLATRLGRPLPADAEAEIELHAETQVYVTALESWIDPGGLPVGRGQRAEFKTVWPKELAVWVIGFRAPADSLLAQTQDLPERFAIVNRKGKVERLRISTLIPANYQPRPADERRALARQAAELACEPIPTEAKPRETSGGERGAAYTAEWNRTPTPDSPTPPSIQVALLAEKVVDVSCNVQPRIESPGFAPMRSWAQRGSWVLRVLALVLVLLLFVLGRCHRLPTLWKRLPLAVALGLIGAWLIFAWNPELPLPLLPIVGFSVGGLAWIGLVTAEHYLRRWAPEQVASYVQALQGQLGEPAVGLAIARGALAGLALVALLTLLAQANLAVARAIAPRLGKLVVPIFVFFPFWVDPTSVGQAAESFSPALFVASAALFDGVVIAGIVLGLAWGLHSWLVRIGWEGPFGWRKKKYSAREWTNVMLFWWFTGLHLHLYEFLPRPFGWIYGFMLLAFVPVWLLRRYDVLTVLAGIATAVLWLLNYPLLVLFREVGNAGHWALFLAWGALVALAAALAFRASLRRARERVVAAFE